MNKAMNTQVGVAGSTEQPVREEKHIELIRSVNMIRAVKGNLHDLISRAGVEVAINPQESKDDFQRDETLIFTLNHLSSEILYECKEIDSLIDQFREQLF